MNANKHNKNFIFGLERREFKTRLGLPLFSLFIFLFIISFSSAQSQNQYSDCSYGNCNKGTTNITNIQSNTTIYQNTSEVDPLSIHNNTYNGYRGFLEMLGVDNYVGYDLGASGFNSVWGARDGSQCNGNYFDSCSGSATSCGEFFSDTSCQMQTGCFWDYDLGNCNGSPQSCDTFSSESSCTQQLGCTANVLSCNGFTDQTSCETKAPDCTWDLIPETYDLQYKSQNYFNFSRPIHATQVNFKTQVGAPFFTMNGLSFMEENSATLLEINRNTPYARLLFDTPSGAVFNLEYPWSRFYQSLIINNQLNVTGLAKFSSNITAPNICYSNGTGCAMDTDWIHNETTHVIYTNDSNDKVCIGSALQCANPSNIFLVNGGANITGITYLDNVATFNSVTGNANFTNNVSANNFFGNLNASYIQNAPWLTTDDDSSYANKSANNIFTGSNNQFVSINGTGNITFPSTSSSLMLGTTSLSDGGIMFNHRISGSGGTVPQASNTGILEITGVDGYTSGTSDSRSALYVSYAPSGSLTRGAVYGAKYQVDDQRASGTLTNLFGFYSQPNVATNAPGTVTTNFGGAFIWLRKTDSRGTVTNAYGTLLDPFNTAGTTAGNITNFYGYRILASGGTITNRWAFYQDGVNDRNFFAGNMTVGYTAQPTVIANLMVNKSAFIGDSTGNTTINPAGVTTTGVTTTGNLVVGGNFSAKRPYLVAYDNSTQNFLNTANTQIINISTIADNYLVNIENKENITFSLTGDYNIDVSPEFYGNGGTGLVTFWIQHWNGTAWHDEPWSNSRYTIKNNEYNAPSVPFQIDISNSTAEKYRLMWWSDTTSSQLYASGVLTSPTRPNIPSVIVRVQKVSEITD